MTGGKPPSSPEIYAAVYRQSNSVSAINFPLKISFLYGKNFRVEV
jgi:hypothetical protein